MFGCSHGPVVVVHGQHTREGTWQRVKDDLARTASHDLGCPAPNLDFMLLGTVKRHPVEVAVWGCNKRIVYQRASAAGYVSREWIAGSVREDTVGLAQAKKEAGGEPAPLSRTELSRKCRNPTSPAARRACRGEGGVGTGGSGAAYVGRGPKIVVSGVEVYEGHWERAIAKLNPIASHELNCPREKIQYTLVRRVGREPSEVVAKGCGMTGRFLRPVVARGGYGGRIISDSWHVQSLRQTGPTPGEPVVAEEKEKPLPPPFPEHYRVAAGPPRPVAVVKTSPPVEPKPPGATLAYSALDQATVRVLAVGTVSAKEVRGRFHPRVLATPEIGHGSGFFVNDAGLVVTAEHVVHGALHVAVHVPGEENPRAARVVHADEEADVAILQTVGAPVQPVTLPEPAPALSVRARVHAVGYPLDASRLHPQSSEGIISGLLPNGRLQLSIGVNSGNSGGPLIDEHEQLIGMIVQRGDVEKGIQNIGVAVPLQQMTAALAKVEQDGLHTKAIAALQQQGDRNAHIALGLGALLEGTVYEAFQEIWETEDGDPFKALPRLERVADTARAPDVTAALAAVFWNASLAALERGGGHATPAAMPKGRLRDTSVQAISRAVELCHASAFADPTLSKRSPFVAYILRHFPRSR